MIERFILSDENETRHLGKILADRLKQNPALIYLRGELGSGKTTLVQGFITSLIGDNIHIQSPTFAYMQRYQHRTIIYHFDLYRIDDENTVSELGLDMFIDDENAIRLIEWPEHMGSLIRAPNIDVELLKQEAKRIAIVTYF